MVQSQKLATGMLATLISTMVLAEPATAPAMKAEDIHGEWKLDRAATIDRAVEAAPEQDKERVRNELGQLLPDQTFSFTPDGAYKVTSTPRGGNQPQTDAGKYTYADGVVHMESSGAGRTRDIKVVRDGDALILQDMLVFRR